MSETLSVLRSAMLRCELTAERSEEILDLLVQFPIELHDERPLVPRIWALRHNLTAYDATYVALAEAIEATLITCDQRMATAAESLDVVVC